MSNEEILEKLLEFGEHLSKGTIFIDVFRTIGWFFVLGLAWFIDQLENITDLILGLKLFYNHPEFVEFVEKFQPILVILFAFNILFIGYLLIFQKEFNRAGVFTNVVMALIIVVLLGSGMSQAERFSSDAIDAINYEEGGNSTLSNTIIRDNITDVSLFDLDGWQTPELEDKNRIKSNFTRDININSYLTKGSNVTADQELSNDGEQILGHKIETLGDGSRAVVKLESGNWITDITQEYYYRYTLDWINMLGTLLVVGVVLITVAIKLAKLFFELAFNYILALFVAPSDMHSGQRMKQVVQNILNIFLVTIMIFLSLKVYMIGTEFLGEYLDGIPYLIAMIGFALAVIDGPNIVERLFGIDAGVKSGWGALAGSYAAAKGAAGLGKGMGKGALAAAKGARSAASKTASTGGFLSGAAHGMMGDGQSDGKVNATSAVGNKADAQVKEQGATGHAGQGEAQGKGNSEGNQNGSTRPTSLHDQMKNRSVAGTNSKGTSGSKARDTSGGVAGAGNGGNKTTGSPQTASVNDQNAQSAAKTGFPNDIEQAFDQVASTVEGSETVGVTDQKQAGGATNGKQATSGSTSGNVARTTSGGGTSGSTSGAASSTSGGTSSGGSAKTSSVKNSQRVSNNVGQSGKEMIEELNEVIEDFSSGGTIEQERRALTNHRQGSNGGQQTVRPTPSSGSGTSGSSLGGAAETASGGGTSGGTSSAASSNSGGSLGGGGAKTSSVKNTQRVSNNVGQSGKEMIEELNEVIEDSSGGGIIEQERRTSTNHRQGSSSGQQTVRQTPSSGGTTTSGGSSGSVTSGGTSSGGTSGGSGSAPRTGGTSSSGSGGTKTSTVIHTTHVTNDIDNSAHEKEVIQENNEVIQEDRHLGQIMKDTVSQRFHSTKTVKNTKRNYQVGRNTGQAIKRNFKKNFTRKK
ncbi:pLS20_p028 family conjugation system transmembrane protein [Halalkalibacter lacteus]|uniref:pLS20_p028 family conjugation system transmembrane protein n=1 Tax=Halalkalibacter lacteus TaxID=3090663 RepID=UPI002FC8D0A0